MFNQKTDRNQEIFDIEAVRREFGISEADFNEVLQETREEFPDDDLLFEIHIIRALRSLRAPKQAR